ncbi:hypothetical protein HKD37_20G056380 [Glycine soja]
MAPPPLAPSTGTSHVALEAPFPPTRPPFADVALEEPALMASWSCYSIKCQALGCSIVDCSGKDSVAECSGRRHWGLRFAIGRHHSFLRLT